MKALVRGALGLLLATAAFAAPVQFTDGFSVTTASVTSTGALVTSGTAGVAAGINRTLFTKSGGSLTTAAQTATIGPGQHYFIMSSDAFTKGIAGAIYTPTSGTFDLTGSPLPYMFSIELFRSDIFVPAGSSSVTFFVTSGSLSDVTGAGANTSFVSLPINGNGPTPFAAVLGSLVGSATLSSVTGLGFIHNGIIDQDPAYDNFYFGQVPEPGTYALMGAGLAALAFLRRRK